jgi:pimeloyl-ACP methyl ester carboxylesterase
VLCWDMPSFHSIRAALAALGGALALGASAQPPPAQAPQVSRTSTFTIFLRGTPIGSEQIALTRSATGWSIVGSGRLGAPLDVVVRRVEVRYTPEWRPLDMSLDATVRGQAQTLHTIVEGTTATTNVVVDGRPATQKTDTIDPAAVLILPTPFFAPYEALAARFRNAAPGTEIPVYSAPQMSFVVRAGESSSQQIQTTERTVAARRLRVTLMTPGIPIDADIWTDDAGRMIRLSILTQSLEVVREDIAAVSSRSVVISRPTDEPLTIPSNGFSLAGTLSKPAIAAAGKQPAVVLVGGSGPADRDGVAFGIPILGEIAGAIADAGFIVVRYDKRGIGQSGGRAESASLADYADDLRAAIKLLSQRKDVDPKRIAVIGHSEGGSVAMVAAAKDKRIAAVGLLATPGVTGAEIVLAQQKRLLDRSSMSAEEKQAKVDAQKRIHEAVISGKGLDQLPPEVRRAVDNAEFQSLLVADPAKIMPDVRKPLLIVQGELDTQVEPSNADRLETLARGRKKAPPVEVVRLPAINHLLAPATTGDVEEYGRLAERHVSPAVTRALVTWLKKIL